MNQTERTAFRESIIIVFIGLCINFPLQTFLLWITIDRWHWSDPLSISIFTQLVITAVALIRIFTLRIFFEMIRFNNTASNVNSNESIEDWLKERKFTEFFKNNYVYPMSASIWSSSQESIGRFPMKSFSRFFNNHGLLDLIKRPQWFSVLDGSNSYIQKLIDNSKINNVR